MGNFATTRRRRPFFNGAVTDYVQARPATASEFDVKKLFAAEVSASSDAEESGGVVQMISPACKIRIGKWKKGQIIGHGNFGKVFLGLGDTGDFFVVKQANFVEADDADVKHLEDEIVMLYKLRHRCIVSYLGAEKNLREQTLSIFLEYMSEGSIADLLKKFGSLNENIVVKYLRDIVDGLRFLHSKRIVHRDIKGQNILLSAAGTVKLADFGLSRSMNSQSNLKSLKGTPSFMAPEVIKSDGYGTKADIWALGCTTVQMLTGKAPFSQFSNAHAAMFHIASGKATPDVPAGASPACQDFLRLCFRHNPDERPTAEDLLQHPFLAMPKKRGNTTSRHKRSSSHGGAFSGENRILPTNVQLRIDEEDILESGIEDGTHLVEHSNSNLSNFSDGAAIVRRRASADFPDAASPRSPPANVIRKEAPPVTDVLADRFGPPTVVVGEEPTVDEDIEALVEGSEIGEDVRDTPLIGVETITGLAHLEWASGMGMDKVPPRKGHYSQGSKASLVQRTSPQKPEVGQPVPGIEVDETRERSKSGGSASQHFRGSPTPDDILGGPGDSSPYSSATAMNSMSANVPVPVGKAPRRGRNGRSYTHGQQSEAKGGRSSEEHKRDGEE
uniref:Protein kinase domain-containing protein n=2 Tax=Palpitomonas bilix TaxID=652834 RepID=A0A7S3GCV5_9EUKA|mmetsp:Transcript_4383/g.8904  ORF Transcript_4383/g.8904 Transcript_4383/m.8904 type:complete len:615 (+) Transcript_4383:186-2030(+)